MIERLRLADLFAAVTLAVLGAAAFHVTVVPALAEVREHVLETVCLRQDGTPRWWPDSDKDTRPDGYLRFTCYRP